MNIFFYSPRNICGQIWMSKFVRVKIGKSLRDVALVVQTARTADALLFEWSQSTNTIIGFYVKPVNFPLIVVARSILIYPALFSSVQLC